MVDYYSLLLRAVTIPGAGDAQWRHGIYDRARQMLANRLRTLRPPPPMAEVAAEQAALEAAIDRIESEMAWSEAGDVGAAEPDDVGTDDAEATWTEPALASPPPFRSGAITWILLAVIIAALGAGGYVVWTSHRTNLAKAKIEASKTEASKTDVSKPGAPKPEAKKPEAKKPEAAKSEAAKTPAPQPARPSATAKDGELAAGVDGGSSDPDQPYVFRRQPTFYRTLQPVGTIIVDKLQHFLYLIQPNSVALRYGIGLGDACKDLVGLRHIASKTEWPPWEATPDMIKRRLASAGTLPGGPGNPLGARLLTLDDGTSRIHGTNGPKTIGNTLEFGCIRLVNDDIVDLYNRVGVNTPVVLN
jgi:lipoprotein-anchoring transpeptidase ErfK/SrfK